VTDSRTGGALAGVVITIAGTSEGTVASTGGEFRLRVATRHAGGSATCSLLGYKSATIPIPSASRGGLAIQLEPLPVEIDRVVVIPEDRLRILLEAAHRRIPENYYTTNTALTGFYRETSCNDAGDYHYFSEAVIDARLNSYENDNDPQIRIVKSVANEFPAIANLNHRWYNGIFTFARADIAKQRALFINPAYYKSFVYTLEPMTAIDGKSAYSIAFRPRDDSKPSASGRVWIDEKTLAYLGAEWESNEALLKRNSSTRWNGIRGYSDKHKILYAESADHRMYMKYSLHDTHLEGEYVSGEYMTTRLDNAPEGTLSYSERIEPIDIFLHEAKQYHDENYWEEYNVFARDSTLDTQLRARFNVEESKRLLGDRSAMSEKDKRIERRRNLMSFIIKHGTRFGGRFGLAYLPVTGGAGLYELSIAGTPVVLSQELGAFEYVPAFSLQYDYNITKLWSVNVTSAVAIGKKLTYDTWGFGVTREFLLNRWGRPWIAEFGLGWSRDRLVRNFSDYTSSADMRLFGKRFDAERVRFGVGYATSGFSPHAGISHRISSRFWIYGNGGFYLPVWTRQIVFAEEKSGFFLGRRSVEESLTDNAILLNYNGQLTTRSHIAPLRWQATLGLMIKL
jgi:hypothetical protein